MASWKIVLTLAAVLCVYDSAVRAESRRSLAGNENQVTRVLLDGPRRGRDLASDLSAASSVLNVDSDGRPISGGRHRINRRRQRRQTGPVGGSSSSDRRSQAQRVTSAPLLQTGPLSLSLLDLPVFSRGDRPSSMDKTLGAIFSKVAFSASNASGPSGGSVAVVVSSSGNKNDESGIVDEIDSDTQMPSGSGTGIESSLTSSGQGTTSSAASSTSTTTTSPESMTARANVTTGRSKPVFEFDTRVFDFIPYDRTPVPDTANRQYNLNVPGLRGPSRINTARHPGNGGNHNNQQQQQQQQPSFNLRPTIPPLVDLSGQPGNRLSQQQAGQNRHQTTTASTTVTTKIVTTPSSTAAVAPVANDSIEEDESLDETTASESSPSSSSSSSTTTTTTSTTTTTVATTTTTIETTSSMANDATSTQHPVGGRAGSTRDAAESGAESRDAAWSIQVYGTSSLYVLLGMFALSNLLQLRTSTRRLLSTSHCLSIQLLVLFLAITRSIHLLYDAYNHRRLLPPALAFSIFNVAFPCLSSALAVLLLGIFKATKLQIMPSALVKPALWAALVAFHFALSLSIDIVVGSVGGLFSLHLASQAYFVLWSLALSLGYFAAFAPATRAAVSLQTETVRSHLTALHVHGASLPRYLPHPTLLKAVRVTLAAAILALLVAAFQLYGMFGVYGLPWRQQPTSSGLSAGSLTSNGPIPVVLTAEFLARYQGLQRDRNLNVDALREVLGLTSSSLEQTADSKQSDYFPVATENFWPWWTYQLIARLLEFVMAALIAYVAVQPWRYNQATMAEKQDVSGATSSSSATAGKKSSLWMFAGRSLKNGSIETLSTLCCQTNRGALNRNGGASGANETVVGVMTDLSPVKSVASDESPYPAVNMRNYCYSNPSSSSSHHQHHQLMHLHQMQPNHSATSSASSSTAFAALYDTNKRSSSSSSSQAQSQQHSTRPRCAINMSHHQPAVSSVLVNDSGFIRFRDGSIAAADSADNMAEQPYEEVDRQRGDHHHSHQHIYQELGYKAPSLTYYSTASSVTSSSNTNKGTATTPSVCTYEHLCRRGLAGYYEPQLYEMQLPNNAQLLSLLAKDSCQMFQPCNIYGGSLAAQQHVQMRHQHCQHCNCGGSVGQLHMATNGVDTIESPVTSPPCGQKASNYESYGPKPEGQVLSATSQADVLQVIAPPDLRNIPIFL